MNTFTFSVVAVVVDVGRYWSKRLNCCYDERKFFPGKKMPLEDSSNPQGQICDFDFHNSQPLEWMAISLKMFLRLS